MSTLDPEEWRAASAELDVILELEGEARAAFLADLRRRDAALAQQVERLLDQHRAARADDFLAHGHGSGLDAGELTRSWDGASAPPPGTPTLAPGDSVGPYRLLRQLGRGGMGIVYEADEIDSGRRVAVKMLEERLDDPRERERFEREGHLAASIDHPHCVFVFAASELHGRPAIAMELMEGTLADRLKASGPLPPAEAVDAALQLVSGLEAAAALGILHRDVKPSNCFLDALGAVKIGDFGISRSLRPTEETAPSTRGRFAATPSYASPEQLRGGPLDLKADIYSLGATLYELLTGRRPLERPDLMSLLMAVANDPPQPPHILAPGVPRGLSQVVLRCLAKRPEHRYASYQALTAALEPYASAAPTPAMVGRRLVAGIIDHLILGLVSAPITFWWIASGSMFDSRGVWLQQPIAFLMLVIYFGSLEATRGASLGKAWLGLMLVDASGRPPLVGRAFARAALYAAVFHLPSVVWMAVNGPDLQRMMAETRWAWLATVLPFVLLGLDFATMRRRNGYAALHDLLTGARVVTRAARIAPRAASHGAINTRQAIIATRGPFDVFDGRIAELPEGWRRGFDRRLRRPVWVRDVPVGTPAISSARARVSRPTRLRWLAGRRQPDQAWDVFETVAGEPLLRACTRPRSWSEVRWWLWDLARECAAGSDAPQLGIARVWVLETGGVKIVDDPALDGEPTPAGGQDCAGLLRDVARHARPPGSPPWPAAAHAFLDRLDGSSPGPSDVLRSVEPLVARLPSVTRGWRALSLAGLVVGPLLLGVTVSAMMALMARQVRDIPTDVQVAARILRRLDDSKPQSSTLAAADRIILERALATRYRHTLTTNGVFAPQYFVLGITPRHRAMADDMVRRNAGQVPPRPDAPVLQAMVRDFTRDTALPPPLAIGTIMLAGSLVLAALASLLVAVTFRHAMMRVLGLEIVTASGAPASRGRTLVRALVAWSPMLALIAISSTQRLTGLQINSLTALLTLMGAPILALGAGAAVAIVRPERGLQDLVAGTWIVPR